MTLYTGGTFDVLHWGHFSFLRACNKLADRVIVGLNEDAFVDSYKGAPPLFNYKERYDALRTCEYVTSVIRNEGGADSKPAIAEAAPDLIAVGSDWAKKDIFQQLDARPDWLAARGITLVYIPYTKGTCTSEIRRRVAPPPH